MIEYAKPEFAVQLSQKTEGIEQHLRMLLDVDYDGSTVLVEAMRYALTGKSKRIRGLLVLGFYELFSENYSTAYSVAAAVEMIHAYSLVQDDLPCLDNDDFRRGKPSCHKAFGEATALLASDALLNLAFETLLSLQNQFSDHIILEMVKELSMSSGYLGMIGGQMIDMESEGRSISEELLTKMHLKKTGALIKASCKLGVIAGNGTPEQLVAAENYGKCMGLAFQIQDDILDIVGDQNLMGKPTGSDKEQQKTTYVSLYGIESAKKMCYELYDEAQNYLKQLNSNPLFLVQLTKMLREREF